MAKEITFTVSGKFKRGTSPLIDLAFGKQNLTLDVAGKQYSRQTGVASTTSEALPLGDVSSAAIGMVLVYNNSDALEMTVGADTTNQPIYVMPKTIAFSPRWNGTAVHVKAVSGAPDYEFLIVER